MQLVDEEDDLAIAGGDFFEEGFEALLEFAPELRAGDQCAHIERDDLLVFETFGHVAPHDALGESLDDGGFANARFTNQHRIVLGAARPNLNDPANFLVAADHRIELALSASSVRS